MFDTGNRFIAVEKGNWAALRLRTPDRQSEGVFSGVNPVSVAPPGKGAPGISSDRKLRLLSLASPLAKGGSSQLAILSCQACLGGQALVSWRWMPRWW